jgi:hypothetical protein
MEVGAFGTIQILLLGLAVKRKCWWRNQRHSFDVFYTYQNRYKDYTCGAAV